LNNSVNTVSVYTTAMVSTYSVIELPVNNAKHVYKMLLQPNSLP